MIKDKDLIHDIDCGHVDSTSGAPPSLASLYFFGLALNTRNTTEYASSVLPHAVKISGAMSDLPHITGMVLRVTGNFRRQRLSFVPPGTSFVGIICVTSQGDMSQGQMSICLSKGTKEVTEEISGRRPEGGRKSLDGRKANMKSETLKVKIFKSCLYV